MRTLQKTTTRKKGKIPGNRRGSRKERNLKGAEWLKGITNTAKGGLELFISPREAEERRNTREPSHRQLEGASRLESRKKR